MTAPCDQTPSKARRPAPWRTPVVQAVLDGPVVAVMGEQLDLKPAHLPGIHANTLDHKEAAM
jgi:hypothetical protein